MHTCTLLKGLVVHGILGMGVGWGVVGVHTGWWGRVGELSGNCCCAFAQPNKHTTEP